MSAAVGTSAERRRLAKSGWIKKMGARGGSHHHPPPPPGTESASASPRSSLLEEPLPPPPTPADIVATKTRFFILSDFRLKYYAKENPKATTEALGILYLTGDATCRSIDSHTLCVAGDSALSVKQGKRYVLVFRTLDEKVEWEFAFHFYLKRCLVAERVQRSMLYGWVNVFPSLAVKDAKSSAASNPIRRLSIVKKDPTVQRLLPPRRNRSQKAAIAPTDDNERAATGGGKQQQHQSDVESNVSEKRDTMKGDDGRSDGEGDDDDDDDAGIDEASSDDELIESEGEDGADSDEEFLQATIRKNNALDVEAEKLLEDDDVAAGGGAKIDPTAVFVASVNLFRGHFLLRLREASGSWSY